MAVIRMVACIAWTMRSRSSLNCHARQHSQMTEANMTVKAIWNASDLKATIPISPPTMAATQPPTNMIRSNLVSGALRTTASTMAPMVPMAPASVGVARPIMIVPRTRKISTPAGMMPQAHLTSRARPNSVRGTGGKASGLMSVR